MNRYNKYIILNSILYFLYCEIKHLFRFFKYLIHRKKDFNVINNTSVKNVLEKNYNFWKKLIKHNSYNDEILVTSLVSLKT